jgi:starch synthase
MPDHTADDRPAEVTGLRALSVASELFPLIKTGGLGDVAGALPRALAELGVEVRSLLPGYPAVLEQLNQLRPLRPLPDLFGGAGRLLSARAEDGLALLVIDAPHLYGRAGHPYLAPDGTDWPDNAERFAALGWVAAQIGQGLLPDWRPDVVHAHDWQAGLAPAYLALSGRPRPATVLTVHNLAFQGQFPAPLLDRLKLPHSAFAVEGVEYYGAIGFLKAGLFFADRLTTVSPTYAREIQTPAFGMGLDGLLRARAERLTGIVNGIDELAWNPQTDPHLPQRYSSKTLGARAANKAQLQRSFGLAEDPSAPLLGVVSRLAWQKGMDLLLGAVPALAGTGAQLAVLGTGDEALEQAFLQAAREHPGAIGCVLRHEEALAHLVQGGADAILVPSRFEPCGLTQLYGLRYGAVPIVSRVGGLADTIVDANEAALLDGVATGLHFAPVTVEALEAAVARAVGLYRDRALWRRMQRRGMTRRVGWSRAAEQYAELYRALTAAAVALGGPTSRLGS